MNGLKLLTWDVVVPPAAQRNGEAVGMDFIRTLNVRFLAGLVASLMVLAVGVVSVHAYQVRRNAGLLKRQAEQATDEKRFDEAVKYYRLFLGYKPDDEEAQLALAVALENRPTWSFREQRKVYELYEAAVRRHPADVALRRKAIDVALRIRRFNDALEHLKS